MRDAALPEAAATREDCGRTQDPSHWFASATLQQIRLADIRGVHAALTHTLEQLHPRPIDDVLVLTPAAVQMLCSQHPLIVRAAGRGSNKGFEVIGGLLAWRALRVHHALLTSQRSSAEHPAGETAERPDAADVVRFAQVTAEPKRRSRRRRSVAHMPLPATFAAPAVVLPRQLSDPDIKALLLAERWLLLTCIGPLKALRSELGVLHQQAEALQWIDELTPGLSSLTALGRVLDLSRQTLHAQQRKGSSPESHVHQPHDTERSADPAAAGPQHAGGSDGAGLD